MKKIIMIMAFVIASIAAYAKPYCQSFNNYDNKVTIVFTDDEAGENYTVTDVKLIPSKNGKESQSTSVSVSVENGVATGTLTFEHLTKFSDPKVEMEIIGKMMTFKVCH